MLDIDLFFFERTLNAFVYIVSYQDNVRAVTNLCKTNNRNVVVCKLLQTAINSVRSNEAKFST